MTWSAGFDNAILVALTEDQVVEYGLPARMGKATDSRASAFMAKHGQLVQVEIDALASADLRELFEAELEPYWDQGAYDETLAVEEQDRDSLD